MSLTHVPSGSTLVEEVVWARSFWFRARGLIGESLPPDRALIISPAKQVHTFFMSFAIDVVFCDAGWNVLHVINGMHPWRVSKWVPRSRYVVELHAGRAEVVRVGDELLVQ